MSKNAIPSQGTTLHIEGASGAAKTITGVAVGNPTIITSNAHGFCNGDVVTIAALTGADAALLNGKTLVVTNKTTNTYALQVDTTGKTVTVGAGTATPVQWIKVGEVKNLKPSGATSSEIDVTDLDSTVKEFRPGLADPGTVSGDINCLDSDNGQAAMLSAQAAQATKNFKITYPSGATPVRTFMASVKKFPDIGEAGVDGVISGSFELRRTGAVTVS